MYSRSEYDMTEYDRNELQHLHLFCQRAGFKFKLTLIVLIPQQDKEIVLS